MPGAARLARLLGPWLVVVAGGLAYANSFDVPFVLDDAHNVAHNPHLRIEALTPRELAAAAFESPSGSRPVANLSFALDYWAHGLDVTGYHAVNLAIHLACALVALALARETLALLERRRDGAGPPAAHTEGTAVVAAAIFAVHPVQTQAVTYVVQRMASGAALFYLAALLLGLRARARPPGGGRAALLGAGLASWLLALGTKQTAATLPAAWLLYDWLRSGGPLLAWLRARWRRVAVAGGALLVLAAVFAGPDLSRIAGSYAGRDFDVGERLLTQPRVVVFYASLVALPLPSRLNLLHDFEPSRSLLDPPTTLAALLALGGALVLALWLAPRRPLVAFGVLWFLLHLAVESSAVGLEMAFEHRLYLPMFGAALLAARGIFAAVPGRPLAALGAAAALVAALAVASHARNATWRDRVTLWTDVVAKSPGSPRAHNSLGRALEREGRLGEAVRHFETALRLDPTHTESHFNLGVVAWAAGRLDEAVAHYRAALRTDPGYAPAHNNLAAALASRGEPRAAVRHFEEALRLDPHHAGAHFNLALLLEGLGRPREALGHYEAALELDPSDSETRRRRQELRRRLAGSEP